MRASLRVSLAMVASVVAGLVLSELGVTTLVTFDRLALAGLVVALLAAGAARTRRWRLAGGAAAATVTVLAARAPLPFVGLAALGLDYGRVGEHPVIALPVGVVVAALLFGLDGSDRP